MQVSDADKQKLVGLLEEFMHLADHVYENTIRVLREGITVGHTNIPVGIQSLGMYADLLHGGAYTTPIEELPYYKPAVQKQIQFDQLKSSSGITFFLKSPLIVDIYAELDERGNVTHPNPLYIALPTGAKAEQVEVILNSAGGAEHRFPKLLSDQQFYVTKEWSSLFNTVDLVQRSSTAVTTFIAGVGEALSSETRAIAGLVEARGKAAKK